MILCKISNEYKKNRQRRPFLYNYGFILNKGGRGDVYTSPGYENEKIYIKVNNNEGGCLLTMALL